MEPPAGGTSGEDASYRAGVAEARLAALETHAMTVNGTIKATGEALNALTVSVNGLGLTIKIRGDLLHEIRDLTSRVIALESDESSTKSVAAYQRWVIGTVLVSIATIGTLAATLTHIIN